MIKNEFEIPKLTKTININSSSGDPIVTQWLDYAYTDSTLNFNLQSFLANTHAKSDQSIFEKVQELFPNDKVGYVCSHNENYVFIINKLMIRIKPYSATKKALNVYADFELYQLLHDTFVKKYKKKNGFVDWMFTDEHGRWNNMRLKVNPNTIPIIDEMYPFIEEGVDATIDAYMKDTANIMLMVGPPGTGKTSFLRHLLDKTKSDAILTYDEGVMAQDQFFINFITNTNQKLMIVEDADILLSSRKTSANKIMAKFLNVSDGLVKLPGKKMVFTTNLDTLTNVDSALIRPGRCFKVINFRNLNEREMNNLVPKLGTKKPRKTSDNTYSLAKIINNS